MLMPSDTTKLSRETSVTPASCWLLVMVAIVACVNSNHKSACGLDTQESAMHLLGLQLGAQQNDKEQSQRNCAT